MTVVIAVTGLIMFCGLDYTFILFQLVSIISNQNTYIIHKYLIRYFYNFYFSLTYE